GDCIAIVGENGSGKSTLAKIIAGLHEVDQQGVYVNGRDLASVDRRFVFRDVSMVTQDYVNYPFTLREGVTMKSSADEDGSYERLQSKFPYLFPPDVDQDTRLGYEYTGSRQLSGGQWQKIAI